MEHVSVMLNQCIELLNIKADGIYVDGTLGRAGHSSSILSHLSDKGHLYCFDIDDEAIQQSNEKLKKISDNFTIINDNFANMKQALKEYGVSKVDGILLDIGVSCFWTLPSLCKRILNFGELILHG